MLRNAEREVTKLMQNYYLAIDIGASSGRHILGSISEGKLALEEVYRFDNSAEQINGRLCWNTDALFTEIKNGMKRCGKIGKIPVSVGIDTWAVDFVLIGKDGKKIGDAVCYRDSRTQGMDKKVYEIIDEDELYAASGIQKQDFNTIYQLMALKTQEPELLDKAESLLMIPDYFHYLLTGRMSAEYTNATSTQLVSPGTKDWDYELIDKLGYKRSLFQKILTPGASLGSVKADISEELGYTVNVTVPATHDTGSAVMAIGAAEKDFIYISSGTWSIMGTEVMEAVRTSQSKEMNFTNEGGYDYRFRLSKNITGLWMIQSVRKELNKRYSYDELCEMAMRESDFPSVVDVNDNMFFTPDSMIQAIKDYCGKTGQRVPESVGEISAVVYQSLAECYKNTVGEVEALTKKHYDKIYVVGGGCKETYLNRLTAEKTGRKISAGPSEATSTGNLIAQMIRNGEIKSLADARRLIAESFDIETFEQGEI
jgi:rhamnulokinase